LLGGLYPIPRTPYPCASAAAAAWLYPIPREGPGRRTKLYPIPPIPLQGVQYYTPCMGSTNGSTTAHRRRQGRRCRGGFARRRQGPPVGRRRRAARRRRCSPQAPPAVGAEEFTYYDARGARREEKLCPRALLARRAVKGTALRVCRGGCVALRCVVRMNSYALGLSEDITRSAPTALARHGRPAGNVSLRRTAHER